MPSLTYTFQEQEPVQFTAVGRANFPYRGSKGRVEGVTFCRLHGRQHMLAVVSLVQREKNLPNYTADPGKGAVRALNL